MATGNIYKIRYHDEEVVTSGGAYVQNNFPDVYALCAGANPAAAMALIPTPPAPGPASHSHVVQVDEIQVVEQNVILS